MKYSFKAKVLWRIVLWCSMVFGLGCVLRADMVELNDGTRIRGAIIKESAQDIVIETAPGMRTELPRSDIKEIKKETPQAKAKGSAPNPASGQRRVTTPISASGFIAPTPTIITDPNFMPQGTWGGLSDGKTIGVDGKPLADHKIYANDTYYFLDKINDGLRKASDPSGKEQLLSMVSELKNAHDSYSLAESTINYEEKLKVKDRIQLDDNPNPKGNELRETMKKAIMKMADLRNQISSQYPQYLEAGQSRGEKTAVQEGEKGTTSTHKVKGDRALFFPYQEVNGSAAKDGLLEDYKGDPISRAKPVVLSKDEKVTFIKSETIEYEKGGPNDRPVTLEVCYVEVESAALIDLKSDKKLPKMKLKGWVLADRLEKE